jgi:hypothetical protein
MPFVYAAYLNHVTTANPNFSRIKDSSLEPLNHLLQGAPAVLNPGLRQRVLEELGLIPFAKQQKYANALNYARQQLNLGIPGIPYAYPVDLRHQFEYYEVAHAAWGHGPQDYRPDGWFEHNVRITWSSSNGNMQSLAAIWNQERVTDNQPPWGPPFLAAMIPHTAPVYTQGNTQNSSHGFGSDNHLFLHPSLMLAYPIAIGFARSEQQYEYSPDNGQTWYQIPGGQFVFERGVRAPVSGGVHPVFYFSKRNRLPMNARTCHFELEYPIGPPPANPPVNRAVVQGRGEGQRMALNTYATVIANI